MKVLRAFHAPRVEKSFNLNVLRAFHAPRVEKSFNLKVLRAFHAHDTGFYLLSENALHERFIAGRWCGVRMENAAAHR